MIISADIVKISSEEAENLCRIIIKDLQEYFRLLNAMKIMRKV